MDKITKALNNLTAKEKERIKNIIITLQSGRFDNLDIKKLKGSSDIFRARIGNMRIIYQVRNKQIFILQIGRRKETTYKLKL